jgi:hypothetical protein
VSRILTFLPLLLKYIARVRDFVLKDTLNTSRFDFISRLVEWASTVEDNVLQHEITEFVATTKRLLFLDIQPLKVDDVGTLVREAQNVSDIQNMFVFDFSLSCDTHTGIPSLMPLFKTFADDRILEAFTVHLGKVAPALAQTPEDHVILQTILVEQLGSEMSKIDFFRGVEITKPGYPGTYGSTCYTSQAKPQRGSPDVTLAFVKKCAYAGHPSLATEVIKHITKTDKITPSEAQARAKEVLLPLVPLLLADPHLQAVLPDGSVTHLGRIAVQLFLDDVRTHAGRITRSELARVLDVAVASANVAMIVDLYVYYLCAYPLISHMCSQCLADAQGSALGRRSVEKHY